MKEKAGERNERNVPEKWEDKEEACSKKKQK